MLRRLGTESRKNNIYKAFRELGRVIRTITLLRFISEPELREDITAATNKAEAYNGFSAWLRFGHDAFERNDPAEQEKIIKFNSLLANCVIFHTALGMTAVIRQLFTEGWTITAAGVAALSPYITERIKRFGEYATDGLTIPPAAFDARLDLHQYAAGDTATASQAACKRRPPGRGLSRALDRLAPASPSIAHARRASPARGPLHSAHRLQSGPRASASRTNQQPGNARGRARPDACVSPEATARPSTRT